jgi:hypothetical protein
VVGGDGDLDGVLFELARDERLTAQASLSGAALSDLGGIHAQCDAFGGGVREHVGQDVQPHRGTGGAAAAGE